MFKKEKEDPYFSAFIASADSACKAAKLLHDTLTHFDTGVLPQRLVEIHAIEHSADDIKHHTMSALAKEFLPPIEREDIVSLSQNLDEAIDKIEDVLIRVYTNNAQNIRPDSIEFSSLIIEICEAMQKLMEEFPNFKKSKTLRQFIVRINELEGEGDRLFTKAMRTLHTECMDDPLQIIAWREIYVYLERCMDTCEHVADLVEGVVLKNL